MSPDERELAWAYLSRVVEPPCPPLVDFLAERDVVEAARLIAKDQLPADQAELRSLTCARRDCDFARRDLAAVAELGGRLITEDSPDWPGWRLLAFARARADSSGQSAALAPPFALWTLGEVDLSAAVGFSCAVVGARAASGYGERVASEWSSDIAEAGGTVISGGAHGVDAASHRGALASGGTTLAVLACGVDVAYPAGHVQLFRRIAANGAVLSEYPPGTRPARHRFLARNRLVAGLSGGVLVVEAGSRSGALNTASWARRLGLPLFAVPGSVFAFSSVGCHALIESGEAELAREAGTLIERVGPIGLLAPERPDNSRALDSLSPEQNRLHGALDPRKAKSVAEISRSSALAIGTVRAELSLLELRGFAKEAAEGGWIRTS
ncbi:DNA-processing protein DprA [Segniliparus rugosus]|uniref:DNA protecting protein DprA n=1 Tax=Segniliparus rugosus (strain ATCC BAA-974 / DSM 45345 / CCUG 50838 / CIP 108380 / JCM 13579 / CDC 945) TaxID=679197 RepID=E5XSI8_SEGRC|nr:DNA-processing protein DprA [Segniliparus rugosus]EFV12665.1 DNA protecting protein DprA [Segniliparus rugosus ATCC BAA-974]